MTTVNGIVGTNRTNRVDEVYIDRNISYIDNSSESSVFVAEKISSEEIDGDIQRIGSENLNKIAQHLADKARNNTQKQARNGLLKVGIFGTIGSLAGVGAVLGVAALISAPITVPVVLLATVTGIFGGAGGAAISAFNTVKNIDENLYDEFAANNLLNDSEHTKSQDAKTEVKSNNFFINFAIKNADYHNAKVSPAKLRESAKEFGLDGLIKLLYVMKPDKNASSPAVVRYEEIDPKVYRNIGDHKRNFEGRYNKETIYVNRAYYDTPDKDIYETGLLSEFINKGELSDAEKDRFLEIAKALSTINKRSVTKEDMVDPAANEKEDCDFFDLNNDKKMDYDDLVILHKLLQAKVDNTPFEKTFDNIRLANIDLNNDGEFDAKDLEILDVAKEKIDINNDGDFNKTDKDILIKYLFSRIKLGKSTAEVNDDVMESLGFTYHSTDKDISTRKKLFLLDLQRKILEL